MILPEGWTVDRTCPETGEPTRLMYADPDAPDPEADDLYTIELDFEATPDRAGNATYTWQAFDGKRSKEWPEGTTLAAILAELASW